MCFCKWVIQLKIIYWSQLNFKNKTHQDIRVNISKCRAHFSTKTDLITISSGLLLITFFRSNFLAVEICIDIGHFVMRISLSFKTWLCFESYRISILTFKFLWYIDKKLEIIQCIEYNQLVIRQTQFIF